MAGNGDRDWNEDGTTGRWEWTRARCDMRLGMESLGVRKGDEIGERVEWEKCEMGLGLGPAMGVGVGEEDSKNGEVGMRWDGHRLDEGDGRLVGWDVLDKR